MEQESRFNVSAGSFARLGLVGAWALFAAACGTAVVPQELHSARDAYAQAQKGVAAELAPAQLESAKQALEKAEKSFVEEEDSPNTVDLSYIALRRVELATLYGEIEQANRDRAGALKVRGLLTEKRLSEAEEELERQKQSLTEERRKREEAEKKAAIALANIASVKQESRGVVITLSGSVLFATGQYTLLGLAKDKLNDVATALKDGGYSKIVVEGHTDSTGDETKNQILSLNRAESVRAYLVSQGIESDKITAVGQGETQPVASNATPDGRANNRRVELVVQPE